MKEIFIKILLYIPYIIIFLCIIGAIIASIMFISLEEVNIFARIILTILTWIGSLIVISLIIDMEKI